MVRDLGLTFAGGGNRSFFQLGLLNRWGARLWPRVGAVAACSAGASVVTLALSGRSQVTHAFWKQRREGVVRNFDWRAPLRGRPPAPHGAVYRDTCLHAFREGGLERIRSQPFPVLVLAATLPKGWSPPLASLIGIGAYSLEKRLDARKIHPGFGRRLGFRPYVADARDCDTPEALADLILASSATPPFTPVGRLSGRPLLDGGLIDNVPAFVAEGVPGVDRNLVMLSRPYPRDALGWQGQRLYVAPSRPTPISRWDYTRPELLEATIAMGEVEADLHEADLAMLLDPNAAPAPAPAAAPSPARA